MPTSVEAGATTPRGAADKTLAATPAHTATMPLSGWLKSWVASQPPQKSEKVMVTESLLMELDFQIQEAEAIVWERELEKKRERNGGVDYSWLVSDRPKPYEMPQLERLELEEMCYKIKPEESGRVISMFRDHITCREHPVVQIPRILRTVMLSVLESRPKEETMPEWMMRSFSSLSLSNITKIRPSRSVAPIDLDSDSGTRSSQSDDRVYTISSIEDLPV